jgi:O-methyltransferase involved in polyketide biosynthesis
MWPVSACSLTRVRLTQQQVLLQVGRAIDESGLDPDKPTIVLSECVLVYMKPEESNALVSFLAGKLSTAAIVVRPQLASESSLNTLARRLFVAVCMQRR